MAIFVKGRRGLPGLSAIGFECTIFDGGTGSLTDRIDQLSRFIAGLRAADSMISTVALFGYSAGGLTARGLLRAYPDLGISAVFQLAAPNGGIVTDDPNGIFRRIYFEQTVIEDMDLESPFMAWLNKTSGHWERDVTQKKRWKLDKTPWVAPKDVPIFNLVGRVPRYGNNSDGVVSVESATLYDLVPHSFIDGQDANHLNLSGAWNPLTLLLRGWRSDDRLWPRAVAASAALFRNETPGV
jgi:pimeloyl-ACP methyl ester carboxylesterase